MNDTARKPAGITVGMRVQYIRNGTATGQRVMGDGQPTAWLCVGTVGKVVEIHGGYAGHPCPDHHKDPNCICGGDDVAIKPGFVSEMEPWGTVEYETDIPGRTIKRAIVPSEKGKAWKPVR
jgi:hypothetical protein